MGSFAIIIRFPFHAIDKGLELAFKNLKKIESLNLTGLGKISGSCFAQLFARNLHIANLKYCEGLDNNGISALVQNCQAIRSLNLFGCSKITDIGIEFIAGYLLGRLVRTFKFFSFAYDIIRKKEY